MNVEDARLGGKFLDKYLKLLEEDGFVYDEDKGIQETYDGKDVYVCFVKERTREEDSRPKTMELTFFINKRSKKIVAILTLRNEEGGYVANYYSIPFDTLIDMIKKGNIKLGELRKYLGDWFYDEAEYFNDEKDFWKTKFVE